MSQSPKILLACPISEHKHYIADEWFTFIRTLRADNLHFYFVDNSINADYHKYIKGLGFDCDYVAPGNRRSQDFMCECNNLIREKVLAENFDFLFSLEEDQFCPRNTIPALLRHKLPVVGANYPIGKGNKRRMFINETIYTDYGLKILTDLHPYIGFTRQTGQLIKVKAAGIGCTLISRAVLEKIKFRIDGLAHADTYFYLDLEAAGIPFFIDTSIHILHKNQDWRKVIQYKLT